MIIYYINYTYCLSSRVADDPPSALYQSNKDHFQTFTNLIVHVPSLYPAFSRIVVGSKLESSRLEHQEHALTS